MSKWIFQPRQQWSGLFTSTNWTDFTLIHLEIEHDPLFGNWNGEIALLGLCLFWRYTYDDNTEGYRRVKASAREAGLDLP